MKFKKYLVLGLLAIGLLAITVASQISQVTTSISAEEAKKCNTLFYNEIKPIYGTCTNYYNYTSCLNASGPNTDCSLKQFQENLTCKIGESIVNKNSTQCTTNSFIVSVDNGAYVDKKEIDFSNWGVCVNSTENNCVAIICGSQHGGSAVNGVFNGCDGGKSCQKFLFCKDSIKVFYKASRNDFVEEDPTFHLSKLGYKEVAK